MLQNSGERFLPSENRGVMRHEHLHRYALCQDLVRGRDVLDVASGEGYGSAMLAQTARSVVGVDVAAEAVEFARRHYYHANARFLVGDCSALPLADASVDVVVSFETIEHHDRHDAMMSEFRRVLRPDGIVVISSPNRLVYSDEPGYVNPYHVKELYFDEFVALLQRHFRYVGLHGQRIAAASFVYPLTGATDGPVMPYVGTVEKIEQRLTSLKSPMYFIAACANDERRLIEFRSLFIDAEDDLVRIFEDERRELVHQLQQLSRRLDEAEALPPHAEVRMISGGTNADTAASQDLPAELHAEYEREVASANARIESEQALVTTLQAQLAASRAHEDALAADLAEIRASQQSEIDALLEQVRRQTEMVREREAQLESDRTQFGGALAVAEQRLRHQAETLRTRAAEAETMERRARHQAHTIALMLQDERVLREQIAAFTRSAAGMMPSSSAASSAAEQEEAIAVLRDALAASQRGLREVTAELLATRQALAQATSSRAWRVANRLRRATGTSA